MKHVFCGIAAVLAVLGYDGAYGACGSCNSCSSCATSCDTCGNKKQTIRITNGNRSTQVVAATSRDNSDSGIVPVVVPIGGVVANRGGNLRYVGGTPSVDGVMPDVAHDGYYGDGSNYYAPARSSRQPTNYRRSNYQRPDYQQRPMNYDDRYVDDYRRGGYDEPRYSRAEPLDSYDSRSSYDDPGLWYVGAHLDLNLLSWKNKYHATPAAAIHDADADHDDYSFKPVIGGNIFGGYRFNPHWRADLEFGFTSRYSDSGGGITFEMSVPYLTANGYYDFDNGLYLGAGIGAGFPTISMEWAYFTGNNSSKTGVTFTAAAMVGYSYYLSDALVLDLRLRVSGMDGPSITRTVQDWDPLELLRTDVGLIWDSTISVGFRYEF